MKKNGRNLEQFKIGKIVTYCNIIVYGNEAEREGFEPPVPEGTLHFECSVVVKITIVYNECVKIIQNNKGLPSQISMFSATSG